MLLARAQLLELIKDGVITNADDSLVNVSTIDLTLDNIIMVERRPVNYTDVHDFEIDWRNRDSLNMQEYTIDEEYGIALRPGQFILAASKQVFNMPDNISAEYSLKSSLARIGIEHMLAGWIDAGFNNSKLTLELKNMTQHHTIILRPNDRIGQVKFFAHEAVDPNFSYRKVGRYNNDLQVSGNKPDPVNDIAE